MLKTLSYIAPVAIILVAGVCYAHDTKQQSDWIGEHNYMSKFGFKCCGFNDCVRLRPEEVEPRKDGIWIERFKELIPYNEATPSEDEFNYRCNRGTARSCFFFKYGSS